MNYPKTVEEQTKAIADFCDIKYLQFIQYIKKSLYIAYLAGQRSGYKTAIKINRKLSNK